MDGPGGLGIVLLRRQMHPLRLNGWSRAKTTIDAFIPALRPLTSVPADTSHPVQAEVARAWAALPPAVSGADGVVSPFASSTAAPTTAPPPSTHKAAVVAARKLSEAHTAWCRGQIRASLSPLGRLVWERASGKGSKAWLDMAPLYPSRSMTSVEARVATSIWLHADIHELGRLPDPSGRSSLRADRAGHVQRHGGLKRTYADLALEGGHRVYTEGSIFSEFPAWMDATARGGIASGSQRKMDVVTVPLAGLTGLAIDPTIIDSTSPDLLDQWRSTVDTPCPLAAAEAVKRAHYADTPPAWQLFPCGHGTQADMGPGAHACAAELARLIATRRNGGHPPTRSLLDSVTREVYGRLGFSVMRELADQIISSFAGSPRAGLTADNAYTHSRFRQGGMGGRSAAGAPAALCSCGRADVARLGCACNASQPGGQTRRRERR